MNYLINKFHLVSIIEQSISGDRRTELQHAWGRMAPVWAKLVQAASNTHIEIILSVESNVDIKRIPFLVTRTSPVIQRFA